MRHKRATHTEGTFEMHSTSTVRVKVEPNGTGVVAHVGLHALGRFADQIGLGAALSSAIIPRGERAPAHDRGKVLVHMALVLAGGGESCLDVEHLRAQPALFGDVASDTTVFRALHELGPTQRAELAPALRAVRGKVWDRIDDGGRVILDVDATLVEVHTESKQGAAPTYKGGFGFHPMACFLDATGECLAARLRPGNAGANTVADHVGLLDEAIAQLPEHVAKGHRVGETGAGREVLIRADAAGMTQGFVSACRDRDVRFMVTARSNSQITAAIHDASVIEGLWRDAVTKDGELREGAAVTELTELVDLSSMPRGTRLIVRREPLHQGAQRSLFPSLDFRYWGFLTDLDGDVRELDQLMREHAHVEDSIARLKDTGLARMPFTSFEANAAWLSVVCLAADLVRWFQLLCLDGPWRSAKAKALRWELFHAPGRLVRRARRMIVRILTGWPNAEVLLAAHRRIALLT